MKKTKSIKSQLLSESFQDSNDPGYLKQQIRLANEEIKKKEQKQQELIQKVEEIEEKNFKLYRKNKELSEGFLNKETQLRRMNQRAQKIDNDTLKYKRQVQEEKRKQKESFNNIEKITAFMYQNYNIHKKNFIILYEGQKQKFNFEKIQEKLLIPEHIQDNFSMMNLSIGSKKRIEEIQKDIQKFQFDLKNHQILYDRLYQDMKEQKAWNNISIEMMLYQDLKNNEQNQELFSPPPEEIEMNIPDISSLSIHKRSFYNKQNQEDSMVHFNLDELLQKNTGFFSDHDNSFVQEMQNQWQNYLQKIIKYFQKQTSIDQQEFNRLKNLITEILIVIQDKKKSQNISKISISQSTLNISDLEDQLTSLESQYFNQQNTNDEISIKRDKMKQKIEKTQEKIEDLKQNKNQIEREIKQKERQINKLQNESRDIQKQLIHQEEIFDDLDHQELQLHKSIDELKRQKISTDQEINNQKEILEQIKSENIQIQFEVEQKLKTQQLQQEMIEEEQKQNQDYKIQLKELEDDCNQQDKIKNLTLESNVDLEIKIEEINTQREVYGEELEYLKQQKQQLQEQLYILKQKDGNKEDIKEDIKEEIDELNKQVDFFLNYQGQCREVLDCIDQIVQYVKFLKESLLENDIKYFQIDELKQQNLKLKETLQKLSEEFVVQKHEYLEKLNENQFMNEIEQKLKKEMENLELLQIELEQKGNEDQLDKQDYIDTIHQKMKELREIKIGNQEQDNQQDKVQDIIKMVKDEKQDKKQVINKKIEQNKKKNNSLLQSIELDEVNDQPIIQQIDKDNIYDPSKFSSNRINITGSNKKFNRTFNRSVKEISSRPSSRTISVEMKSDMENNLIYNAIQQKEISILQEQWQIKKDVLRKVKN